ARQRHKGSGVRIARFAKGDGVAYGVVEGEPDSSRGTPPRPGLTIAELYGHPFGVDPGGVRLTGNRYPLAEVRLLAPVLPSKVVAAGRNYASHAQELNGEPPGEPVIFLKPSTSVTGTGRGSGVRLHLRQRRHRAGPAGQGRAVDPGQGIRHVLPARAVDGDRDEPR